MTIAPRALTTICIVAVCFSGFVHAAETEEPETKAEGAIASETKVSVKAEDQAVKEILESFATQSKQRFVIESTVKGTISSLSLSDVSLESALNAVCKSARCEWRQVYLDPNSKLLEQPDKLAATVRLLSGMSFPDLVLASSSSGKTGLHCIDKEAVAAAQDDVIDKLGLSRVYLITNDAAVAEAVRKKGDEDKETSENVATYVNSTKELMDVFIQMTPEERERAMMEAMNLMDQTGPGYMAAVTRSLLNSDPNVLRTIQSRNTQMLFEIPTEQRRALMKLQMHAMEDITPEQMKMLEEDALAIRQELAEEGGMAPNQ